MKRNKVKTLLLSTIFLFCLLIQGATVFAIEDNTIVSIPDIAFKQLLNKQLGVQNLNADITKKQMNSITSVNNSSTLSSISDLTGAEHLININYFYLRDSAVSSLQPLSSCKKLTKIYLFNCNELTSLKGLESLEKLNNVSILRCKTLTDISALSKLNTITSVNFEGNEALSDITPLKGKTSITKLNLEKVRITEFNQNNYMGTIRSLTSLKDLCFAYSGIEDSHLSMFDSLINLEKLILGQCNITDLSFLIPHKDKLTELTIHGNSISDATPLKQLTKLTSLGFGSNNITDFSFISSLPNLSRNGSRWAEGGTSFPMKQNHYYSNLFNPILLSQNTTSYTVKNIFKDEKGQPIAPLPSDDYLYNEADNTIVFLLPNGPARENKQVNYSTSLTTQKNTSIISRLTSHIYFSVDKGNPSVTITPDYQSILAKKSFTLTTKTTGNGLYQFQWYRNNRPISNATSSTFTVTNAQLINAGEYHVTISSNTLNPLKSSTAYISMGDVNKDKKVDMEDVLLVQRHIAKIITLAQENFNIANVNGDNTLDMADTLLLQKYIAKLI